MDGAGVPPPSEVVVVFAGTVTVVVGAVTVVVCSVTVEVTVLGAAFVVCPMLSD